MQSFNSGRLTAQPLALAPETPPGGTPTLAPGGPGLHCLGLEPGRDGLLYAPPGLRPGAGADSTDCLRWMLKEAEAHNIILLSPDSRGSTWDMLRGGFGPDVAYIDKALQHAFSQCKVDPERVCISGFSDGASYALSLGVANGGLFTHIAAFSPGFMRPPRHEGKPLIYVSHGEHDRVLRIDYCSRRVVPQLEARGYNVAYREFDGPHVVPPSIAAEAMQWLVGSTRAG